MPEDLTGRLGDRLKMPARLRRLRFSAGPRCGLALPGLHPWTGAR
jgi:hypothetical protein